MSPNGKEMMLDKLHKELRKHIARLALVSVASYGFGVEAYVSLRGEWNTGFGVLTVGWATVNLLICALSWWGKPPQDAVKFRNFLKLNLWLNLAYIGVGWAMATWGNLWVWGAGVAIIIQGALLLLLDCWLWRVTADTVQA